MQLARVIGNIVSTLKNEAYEGKKLLLVQRLSMEGKPMGLPTVAIDYVGAGDGDVVLLGSAPGLARTVFKISPAPMRELIMGVVDRVDVES